MAFQTSHGPAHMAGFDVAQIGREQWQAVRAVAQQVAFDEDFGGAASLARRQATLAEQRVSENPELFSVVPCPRDCSVRVGGHRLGRTCWCADGASPLQLFRLVYLPLMTPSLVAVGTYALLLAWNEYLYAFLLLSNERDLTLGVALGYFLNADDSPWELLMTTGLIYALPPAAIYYAFKRYMVSGLTAGAVKS